MSISCSRSRSCSQSCPNDPLSACCLPAKAAGHAQLAATGIRTHCQVCGKSHVAASATQMHRQAMRMRREEAACRPPLRPWRSVALQLEAEDFQAYPPLSLYVNWGENFSSFLDSRDLMGILHPETGNRPFPDFFSGHWSRNRVATCHFFHTVSGFRIP